MSRPPTAGDGGLTRDAIGRLFARLTADRDELRAAMSLCEARLARLEHVLQEPAAEPTHVGDAHRALRLAEEALATAQYALQQARLRRS